MATQARRKWQRAQTTGRLELIRQHLDKTDEEIGRKLGITRQAVNLLRQRYQIAKAHSMIQRRQQRLERLRQLKPWLTVEKVARQLGVESGTASFYGRLAGYQFLNSEAARHFHWRERIKRLPPLLTISAVARKLGVSYSHAALLCHRHKYRVTITARSLPGRRVPTRKWVRRPKHERWLASLKPPK